MHHTTGAPLERVPRVPGNPSILGKAKYNTEDLRKTSLNFNNSQEIQNLSIGILKGAPAYLPQIIIVFLTSHLHTLKSE